MERWVLQQTFPNWDSLRIMNARTTTWSGCTPTSPRRRSPVRSSSPRSTPNRIPHPRTTDHSRFRPPLESLVKFSYVMLPDYPLDRVPAVHPARRRARLLRRLRRGRDLAQGPLAAVRRGRRQDEEHPDGPERLGGRSARADRSSPRPPPRSTSSPKGAPRSCCRRATSGCSRSTASTGASRSRCRGCRRACTSSAPCSTTAPSPSTASSSPTRACSPSPARPRTGCR